MSREKGVKLELVVSQATAALIDGVVGGIYGPNRAAVARFLLQSGALDRWPDLQDEAKRLKAVGGDGNG